LIALVASAWSKPVYCWMNWW